MSISRIYSFCNNCGKNGHVFHQCKHPITSIGIIAFRNTKHGLEYLMIRRKDTLGFVDFMRGKYSIYNKLYILNIINEMTLDEKKRLLHEPFEKLWLELWGNNIGIQYRIEEKNSKEKFDQLKIGVNNVNYEYSLSSLIDESNTIWIETEWGFPKGRRNYQEKDIIAGLREFEEETGYSKNNLHVIQNVMPIEEIFTGSNYKSYKHKYYLAHMNMNVEDGVFQDTEVSKLQWLTFDQAIKYIRPYNLEKINVLKQVNTILTKYQIYI